MKYSSSRLLEYIMSKFSLISLLLVAPVILADDPQTVPGTSPEQHIVAGWLENGVYRRNAINDADQALGFLGVNDEVFYTDTRAAPSQPFILGYFNQGGIFYPLDSNDEGEPIAVSLKNGISGYFDFNDGRFYKGDIPRAVLYATVAIVRERAPLVRGFFVSAFDSGIFYPGGNPNGPQVPKLGSKYFQGTPIESLPTTDGLDSAFIYAAPALVLPVINALPVVPFKR